jgi:stage V sporulation protein G
LKTKPTTITAEVRKLFNDGGKAKAILTVNIGGDFVVRGVRLVDGAKGMFISMPSRKVAEGEYQSVCFPITEDLHDQIFNAVLNAYEKAVAEQTGIENTSKYDGGAE